MSVRLFYNQRNLAEKTKTAVREYKKFVGIFEVLRTIPHECLFKRVRAISDDRGLDIFAAGCRVTLGLCG